MRLLKIFVIIVGIIGMLFAISSCSTAKYCPTYSSSYTPHPPMKQMMRRNIN